MPIYEYECTACCNVTEVFQRMTEDPLTICPECSGPVKKLVSRSSFHLKGSGWYADGYCSNSRNGSGCTKPDTSAKDCAGKTAKKKGCSPEATPCKKSKESCSAVS